MYYRMKECFSSILGGPRFGKSFLDSTSRYYNFLFLETMLNTAPIDIRAVAVALYEPVQT